MASIVFFGASVSYYNSASVGAIVFFYYQPGATALDVQFLFSMTHRLFLGVVFNNEGILPGKNAR